MVSQTITPIDLGDASFIEIPYVIEGVNYVLKEASGDAACFYKNSIYKATELGSDGSATKIGNMADTEPLLVSLCLYRVDDGLRPSLDKVRKWPARIIKILFDKAKEISELEEEPEEKAQLVDALSVLGSPCSYSDLVTFVNKLPKKDFGELQKWLGDSVEDTAKNGQKSTADGSDSL